MNILIVNSVKINKVGLHFNSSSKYSLVSRNHGH